MESEERGNLRRGARASPSPSLSTNSSLLFCFSRGLRSKSEQGKDRLNLYHFTERGTVGEKGCCGRIGGERLEREVPTQ